MNLITNIIELLIALVSDLGYLGILLGMTIESSIIPFPAELILPPAGVLVSRGDMSFILVLAMAIVGSILGALVNYFIAYYLGRKTVNKLLLKYGKIFFIKKEELIKSENTFRKHGEITTFFGRLIPGIRSFVSLPAGFYKMNLMRFCFFTGLGAGIWSAILIYLGMFYGENQDSIENMLGSLTWIIIAVVLIIILIYIYIRKKLNLKIK
ncbi:MAG: DedA family protein [Nanoarchaeota archaeon]